jgi:hypothetical protein
MKIYAYILIVLSGVLTAQCSKVTLDEICGYPPPPPRGEETGKEKETGIITVTGITRMRRRS